jgi:hypothetical protein
MLGIIARRLQTAPTAAASTRSGPSYAGTFYRIKEIFMCVPANLYARPAEQIIASGEQALCDFAWLSLREGIDPRHLVTFSNLGRLSRRRLKTILQRYPEQVRDVVEGIVAAHCHGSQESLPRLSPTR